MSRDEIICYLYEFKKMKDEKHFLLEYLAYAHITSQFQNICNNTNIFNVLTHQNNVDLGKLILNLFGHKIKLQSKPINSLPFFLKLDKPKLFSINDNTQQHHHYLVKINKFDKKISNKIILSYTKS